MNVANSLLEQFEATDERDFEENKGSLVKKYPHLTIRKYKL